MSDAIDLIEVLTDPSIPASQKLGVAETFSRQFGWRPNDLLDVPQALPVTNMVVERGLDNAAVLSFLPPQSRLRDIRTEEQRRILGLSYNSLIDWHVWVDQDSVKCFYNRTNPPSLIFERGFDRHDYSVLAKHVFDQAIGQAPNPNIPALDGALLGTIADWRQILHLELGAVATAASISALFNAIILARAVEDFHARVGAATPGASLLELISERNVNLVDAIEQSIRERTKSGITPQLFDRATLAPFDRLAFSNREALIKAFYRHDSVPYDYDFSVMSKHALSKIYERYVAVMQHAEAVQVSMFPSVPEESWNKHLGGIYTPQYIASFFARYLRDQLSPERFIQSSVADPACGSGVFLRAAMEQKLLASQATFPEAVGAARAAMGSLLGIDIEESAVAASRLSLALLHLAGCGELPDNIPIEQDDSIARFALSSSTLDGSFDAVMANPPFVRTESQSAAVRQAVAQHVGALGKGKLDTYLAFLALSIRALRPGGWGFFVLPQPFLTSDNLKALRDWVLDEAWVRVIADLSAIRVFKANVYIVLLIVQRKYTSALRENPVSLIRCHRDVGLALEAFLDRERPQTASYFIYDAPQESLRRATWSVATPDESSLLARLESMTRLSHYAVVRQGTITGADNVFVIDTVDVPSGEEAVYRPFLPDRMIGRFALPKETGKRVFYPYVGNATVTSSQLESDFPKTWAWLGSQRETLSSRSSWRGSDSEWWRPVWPRPPHEILVPKIVVPELSLLPRFGFDSSGRWVVSHSPFVRARAEYSDQELLLLLTAALNSSVSAWFIDLNARKYRDGYNKIGVSLLQRMPVPNLASVSSASRRWVLDHVRELAGSFSSTEFDHGLASSLDDIVLRDLYFLTEEDIALVKPSAHELDSVDG